MEIRITVFAPNGPEAADKILAALKGTPRPGLKVVSLLGLQCLPAHLDEEGLVTANPHVLVEHPPITAGDVKSSVLFHEFNAFLADKTQLPVRARMVRERDYAQPVEPTDLGDL